MDMKIGNEWALVLAGGEGERLGDETVRRFGVRRPKQFCDFGAGETLLASTLAMAAQLVDESRVVLSSVRKHRSDVDATLVAFPRVVVAEQPEGRGTLPGILLPMRQILLADPDAVVTVFPSDHHWEDRGPLFDALREETANVRREPEQIVLFGAEPVGDCSGFGLIVPSKQANTPPGAIARFCEKPGDAESDALRSAGAVVNTFVMVGHVATFAFLLAQTSQRWWSGLARSPFDPRVDEAIYASLPPADFSRDIIQVRPHAFRVRTLGRVGWNDLGDPARLERVWPHTVRHGPIPAQ